MKQKIIYQKADTHFFVNEDKDLIPIRIPLPDCPDITTIDGYGLLPKEQKFQYQKEPYKLKKLVKDCEGKIDAIWDVLNKNQINYRDEIKWIKKQWYHRLFGYWFFNKGKPTYLDGWHFFYLNYWHLDVGLPRYRDRDRRWMLAQRFAYNDTTDFVHKDKDGNAIPEADGSYKMYDTGKLVCWGTCDEKFRQAGDSSKSLCIGFLETTQNVSANMGIQAEVASSAKKNFGFVTHAWKKIPFFFQPSFDNPTNPQEKLNFTTPSQRGMSTNIIGLDTGLESTITWASTANGGFYDGWKLIFYLGDEEGKTLEYDIVKRWDIVRKCLGPGNTRTGFSIHPSTVGDMNDEGGENFWDLSHKQSNYYNRNENGQTKSGLYNYYFKSVDGLEGCIDEYGMSLEDEARKYHQNTLDNLLKENTERSLRKYRAEKRLMPMTYADCWQTDSGDIGMPYEKINVRINDLRFDKYATRRVRMYRKDNNKEGIVLLQDDPDGRFLISLDLPANKQNQRFFKDGSYFPKDPKFIASADTYKVEKDKKDSKHSDGGGSVFWEHDELIDPIAKDIKLYQSNRFVCEYLARPTLEEYYEDMLMMCEYFGAMMYAENNINTVSDHFKRRGRGGYLLYEYDIVSGRFKETPGFFSNVAHKQELFNEIINYLKIHGQREQHINFLNDCLKIKGLDDMRNYDRFTAFGGCLMGVRAKFKEFNVIPEHEDVVDLAEIFPRHRY
jgi:hypothetical protein